MLQVFNSNITLSFDLEKLSLSAYPVIIDLKPQLAVTRGYLK
jgi:hypothetical protein